MLANAARFLKLTGNKVRQCLADSKMNIIHDQEPKPLALTSDKERPQHQESQCLLSKIPPYYLST